MLSHKQTVEIKASAQQELGSSLTILKCLQDNPGKWISASAFTKAGKTIAKKLAYQGILVKGYHVEQNGSHTKVYKFEEKSD